MLKGVCYEPCLCLLSHNVTVGTDCHSALHSGPLKPTVSEDILGCLSMEERNFQGLWPA